MKGFRDFLRARNLVPEDKVVYYQGWVSKFTALFGEELSQGITGDLLDAFGRHLNKRFEEWQIKQAKEAVRLYGYYKAAELKRQEAKDRKYDDDWKRAAEEMQRILRLKHRALSTERSYLGWLREFETFVSGRSPHELLPGDAKNFLSYLAVDRRIAESTQNQAFNALLFFFRHVLDRDIDDFDGTVRAERKRTLPVVLSRKEVYQLFEELSGEHLLAAKVIYGCGLRVKEFTRL